VIRRADLKSLRNSIEEARRILATTQLPPGRAIDARELITSAVQQADSLLATPTMAMMSSPKRAKKFQQRIDQANAKETRPESPAEHDPRSESDY